MSDDGDDNMVIDSPSDTFPRWMYADHSHSSTSPSIHRPLSSQSSVDYTNIHRVFSSQGVCLEPSLAEQNIGSLSPVSSPARTHRQMSIASDTTSFTRRSSETPSVRSQPSTIDHAPLMAFLGGLEEHPLLMVMMRLGFTTEARLDALARNRDMWSHVAKEIKSHGTLSDWILVKDSLEARARRLEKVPCRATAV